MLRLARISGRNANRNLTQPSSKAPVEDTHIGGLVDLPDPLRNGTSRAPHQLHIVGSGPPHVSERLAVHILPDSERAEGCWWPRISSARSGPVSSGLTPSGLSRLDPAEVDTFWSHLPTFPKKEVNMNHIHVDC
jgi:hypothetical protein